MAKPERVEPSLVERTAGLPMTSMYSEHEHCFSNETPVEDANSRLLRVSPERQTGTLGHEEQSGSVHRLPEPVDGNDPGVARMLGAVALAGLVLLTSVIYGLVRLFSG
jgi:hypothetical protein